MRKRKIYILLDYLNTLYSKDSTFYGLDLENVKKYFISNDYDPVFIQYSEIDFRKQNYYKQLIIYQSSEDKDHKYKNYINDMLLGLKLQGAHLIPDYKYFVAHDNKVFSEILRDLSSHNGIKNIVSKKLGTYEEFLAIHKSIPLPAVFKLSSGALSRGVKLIIDNKKNIKDIHRLSKTLYHRKLSTLIKKPFVPLKAFLFAVIGQKRQKTDNPKSKNREKFILQNYIPNLRYDYKVLVFDSKYYVLKRETRANDFRASGSGLIHWIENPPPELLEFAQSVFKSFTVPFISLDIGHREDEFFLFEFQIIYFGH
jgi:glutathione synthase/RimK-type ligase-like ATP-grasp enzyme